MNSNTIRLLVAGAILLLALCVLASPTSSNINAVEFFAALNQVEASGKTSNVPAGDNGLAIGPLQIHYAYWRDANVQGHYDQCTNYSYACLVVSKYMQRYCRDAWISGDWQTCARVHNGGPRGACNKQTLAYWRKVERYLRVRTY